MFICDHNLFTYISIIAALPLNTFCKMSSLVLLQNYVIVDYEMKVNKKKLPRKLPSCCWSNGEIRGTAQTEEVKTWFKCLGWLFLPIWNSWKSRDTWYVCLWRWTKMKGKRKKTSSWFKVHHHYYRDYMHLRTRRRKSELNFANVFDHIWIFLHNCSCCRARNGIIKKS